MTTEAKPGVINLANWTKLARLGSTTAVSGLSQMVNKDFSITALEIEEVSKRNAAGLLGKADTNAIGIYLTLLRTYSRANTPGFCSRNSL